MCGRLSLTAADHRAAARMLAEAIPAFKAQSLAPWLEQAGYSPRSNVGPGQDHWLIRGRGTRPILDRGRWGMAAPDKPQKLVINARGETVDRRPMFRGAFAQRRALIPADGFFEWSGEKGRRQPHWFHHPDRAALLFAAVFDAPRPDAPLPRFSIITVPASASVAPIHHRMPAIVETAAVDTWLFAPPTEARALLVPSACALEAWSVSPAFNHASHEGPIEALARPATPQPPS